MNILTFIKVYLVIGMPLLCGGLVSASSSNNSLSPTALAVTKDGRLLFIACATANCVLLLDPATGKLASIALPGYPSGLALSANETQLFVTCAAPVRGQSMVLSYYRRVGLAG